MKISVRIKIVTKLQMTDILALVEFAPRRDGNSLKNLFQVVGQNVRRVVLPQSDKPKGQVQKSYHLDTLNIFLSH